MEFCNRKINAIIFDLDGTLLASTNIWGKIDQEFFGKRGMEIPPTYAKEIAHIGLMEASVLTQKKYCPNEKAEDILKEWQEGTKHHYEQLIQLKPYVIELLEKLKKENIKLAVATANDRALYEPCLKRLKIYDYFSIIVDVDTVKSGKNSVKIYDYIAEKLNEKRENIAVFEDIYVGLKTAYEHGYLTIGVYDEHSCKDEELVKKYSHKFIKSFKEIL